MSFLKSISNALASIRNSKTNKQIDSESTEENISEELVGEKIGISSEGQLNVGIQELSGYLFLEAFILSKANIKTFNGATLTFISDKNEFTLKSDTLEIKSDLINRTFKYFTQISFDISEKEIDQIKKGDYSTIQLNFKKKTLHFNKVI